MNADAKLFFCLIFLTVAVVAGTVVSAAWIQSSRDDFFFFLGNAEELKITSLEFNGNNMATFTIKNFGSNDVMIDSAKINGQPAALKITEQPSTIIPKHASANFLITLEDGSQFNLGEQYQFTIVTTKGTPINYTATYSLN